MGASAHWGTLKDPMEKSGDREKITEGHLQGCERDYIVKLHIGPEL